MYNINNTNVYFQIENLMLNTYYTTVNIPLLIYNTENMFIDSYKTILK